MSEWQVFKLENFADINPTESIPKSNSAKKVPMENIEPFTKKVKGYTIEKYNGGVKFKNGDTIVARITPSLENGKTAFIDILEKDEIGFGSTEFIVLREKEGLSDKNFLYYLALSPDFRETAILSMTGSSGRQRVQTDVVKEHLINLPPLPEQRAIAFVLSGLDDKIDLLHRQNKTLEEMAETLFRQWFVVEASEEWEVKPLNYFGNIICGKTPSKKKLENFGGNILFIKIPDMHGKVFVFDTTDTLSVIGKESQINKTLPPWSINVSCIATVGLVTMNAFEAQTTQQINSIIPDEKFRYYLYYEMKNSYDLLQSMASGGTATLNLNTGNFSRIEITLTDEETLLKFNDFAEHIFAKIYKNQTQIRTLKKLRDTLLPKLMSGEVKVSIDELKKEIV